MEIKKRKLSHSATNHGFTIPAKFCRKSHVHKGDVWEWYELFAKNSGMLALIPIPFDPDHRIEFQNKKNVVSVQEMRFMLSLGMLRRQYKLNIPIDLIRKYRINISKCKMYWLLSDKNALHGEIVLRGENVY